VRTTIDVLHEWRRHDDSTTEPARRGSVLGRGVRSVRPVHSLPELVELIGKEGDDLRALQVDPCAVEGRELTCYHPADVWEPILEKIRAFDPGDVVKRTGLAPATVYRLLNGRPPSPATAAVVGAAFADDEIVVSENRWHPCGRPGCGLLVCGRRRWCSETCRKAVQRSRDVLALHAVGGKRCRRCGAARFGDQRAPCPTCEGQRPVEVPTVTCRGCGVERVGDTLRPCPFCESKGATR
jgi:hypothetical protein